MTDQNFSDPTRPPLDEGESTAQMLRQILDAADRIADSITEEDGAAALQAILCAAGVADEEQLDASDEEQFVDEPCSESADELEHRLVGLMIDLDDAAPRWRSTSALPLAPFQSEASREVVRAFITATRPSGRQPCLPPVVQSLIDGQLRHLSLLRQEVQVLETRAEALRAELQSDSRAHFEVVIGHGQMLEAEALERAQKIEARAHDRARRIEDEALDRAKETLRRAEEKAADAWLPDPSIARVGDGAIVHWYPSSTPMAPPALEASRETGFYDFRSRIAENRWLGCQVKRLMDRQATATPYIYGRSGVRGDLDMTIRLAKAAAGCLDYEDLAPSIFRPGAGSVQLMDLVARRRPGSRRQRRWSVSDIPAAWEAFLEGQSDPSFVLELVRKSRSMWSGNASDHLFFSHWLRSLTARDRAEAIDLLLTLVQDWQTGATSREPMGPTNGEIRCIDLTRTSLGEEKRTLDSIS